VETVTVDVVEELAPGVVAISLNSSRRRSVGRLTNQNKNRRPRRRLQTVIRRSAVRVRSAVLAKSKILARQRNWANRFGQPPGYSASAVHGGRSRRRLAFIGDDDTLICERFDEAAAVLG
jgi:hypothetical protein